MSEHFSRNPEAEIALKAIVDLLNLEIQVKENEIKTYIRQMFKGTWGETALTNTSYFQLSLLSYKDGFIKIESPFWLHNIYIAIELNKLTNSKLHLWLIVCHKITQFQGDLKKTWKTINQVINKKSNIKIVPNLTVYCQTVTGNKDIALSMNEYFCNIGNKLSEKIPKKVNPLLSGNYLLETHPLSFSFSAIMAEKLSSTLNKMENITWFKPWLNCVLLFQDCFASCRRFLVWSFQWTRCSRENFRRIWK